MKNDYNSEKILIIVALFLFAGIIFYNAFFIPQVAMPTVIYVDSDDSASANANTDVEEIVNADDLIALPDGVDGNSNQDVTVVGKKININTATAEELATNLPGIGESIAKRIVEYRIYNGDFVSIDEIKNVSGIGEAKFEAIKELICV